MRSFASVLMLYCCLGCGSIPITFHGKSFDEYVDKSNSSHYTIPAALQQRWQLVSINGDVAPLDTKLAEHNFFIYFRTNRAGKDKYQFGGKITQGFWGEYTFDGQGSIEILVMRGMEKNKAGNASSLESLFERVLVTARTYEITGTAMKLHSPTDTLKFISPVPRAY